MPEQMGQRDRPDRLDGQLGLEPVRGWDRWDLLAVVVAVLLAGAVRLPRLAGTPGWDGDEGYNLSIAWNLLHGSARAFAVSQRFVQHPVLYYAVLAPLLAVTGPQIWAARLVAALAGTITAGLTYLAARPAGRRVAVLASLAFAGAHFIVLYNRLAYTYDLLLVWVAATLIAVQAWERGRTSGWLVAASAAASLGVLTDQVGIALPVFVALRVWPRKRLAFATLAGSLMVPALLALALYVPDPAASGQDWRQSLWRVGSAPGDSPNAGYFGSGGAIGQVVATRVALWLVNAYHLLRAEWWWPVALVGLWGVRPLAFRRRVLALFGVLVVPIFALREIEPFFRTAVPLFVPAAIGLGSVLDAGFRVVYQTMDVPETAPPRSQDGERAGTGRRLLAAALVAGVVLLPLGLEVGRSTGALIAGFQTRFDWALVQDQDDARRAAALVSSHARLGDVVVTSPQTAWLFPGRVADFFQLVTWEGEAIAFYPAGMDHRRFAYPLGLDQVRFAVLDPFWMQWVDASPPLAALTLRIEAWPLEAQFGPFRVYENPALATSAHSGGSG